MSRNKLYTFLALACIAGYIWLFINHTAISGNNGEVGVCIIKHITNIPCPSCGSTRSVILLLQGNILESLYWNPIGAILVIIMVTAPMWIAFDCFSRKGTLFVFYKKMEAALRQKKVALPMILLVLANWIWNIYKGL